MTILLYQIGIFLAIIISASYGKSSRNVAVVLISIFTLLQVYYSGLMFVQFLTIIISYFISNQFFQEKKDEFSRKTNYSNQQNITQKSKIVKPTFEELDPDEESIRYSMRRIEEAKENQRIREEKENGISDETRKIFEDIMENIKNKNK